MFWTLHLNIQSISQNGSQFNVWLSALSIKFSVIGITQTWLNKTELVVYILVYYCKCCSLDWLLYSLSIHHYIASSETIIFLEVFFLKIVKK